MSSERPHAPSEPRIREARASGHAPRAELAGFSAALVVVLGCACWLGPRGGRALVRMLDAPLLSVARGRFGDAATQAAALARGVVRDMVLVLAAVLVAATLARAVAQRPSFARMGSTRLGFPPLRVSRTAQALWCAGLLFCLGDALHDVVLLDLASVAPAAARLATNLALVTVGCAVVDAAFARARFFASLFLTRREYLDAQREAVGSPELRAARARARQQLGAGG